MTSNITAVKEPPSFVNLHPVLPPCPSSLIPDSLASIHMEPEDVSCACFHYSTQRRGEKKDQSAFLHSSVALKLLLPFENMKALE